MKKKRRLRRRPRTGRARRNGASPFRDILAGNAHCALRDERYALIQRCVEETLKDPELREKIDYYSRQIIKAIAAKL